MNEFRELSEDERQEILGKIEPSDKVKIFKTPYGSRIFYIDCNDTIDGDRFIANMKERISKIKSKKAIMQNKFDDKFLEDAKDFILKMLGAPIVKIELDDQQLQMCVDRTAEFMASSEKVGQMNPPLMKMVFQDGALAHAKLMLGRIRTKFGALVTGNKGVKTKPNSPIGANSIFPTDGQLLLTEGERQYEIWQSKVV